MLQLLVSGGYHCTTTVYKTHTLLVASVTAAQLLCSLAPAQTSYLWRLPHLLLLMRSSWLL